MESQGPSPVGPGLPNYMCEAECVSGSFHASYSCGAVPRLELAAGLAMGLGFVLVLVAGLGVLMGGLREEPLEDLRSGVSVVTSSTVSELLRRGEGREGTKQYVELADSSLSLGVYDDTVTNCVPEGAVGDGWGEAPSEGESMAATIERHHAASKKAAGGASPKSPGRFAAVLVE